MHQFWNTSEHRKIRLRVSNTILESFFILCSEMGVESACYDEQVGKFSYAQVKKAVIALSLKIATYPDQHIGIMMPSSIGAYIAYFAVLLANKIPVMINWSQGLREIEASSQLSEVNHVLTSRKLVQHLHQVHGEDAIYPFEFIYMEDVRNQMSLWDKLRTACFFSLPHRWLLKLFKVSGKSPDDIAVILFTSGTEKLPKGVPLTNANLIANQKACLKFFDPTSTDVMMSFLPPFHAYGFNCCALFPLLTGLPVVFAYNPLYPKKIVELMEETQVTFLGSTPVFFDYILKTAKKLEAKLQSLRFVVIGGDVFKESLHKEALSMLPHTLLYQGYGTTECSPVISVTTPDSTNSEACVGIPIEGMDVLIISEETNVPVSSGEVGLVVVRGTSLFHGYLGDTQHRGFINLGGDLWYVTGDLGYLNHKGELFLKGRLSRFVKIGGEMVSLEALESILINGFSKLYPDDHPNLIVSPISGDKVRLCLFTTFATNISEANDILKESKTSSIMKISYQYQLESIPMLGTGKPDYGKLNVLALSLFGGKD
ncbi:AMP-binding enzyme family protein [Chlamydia ibidis]|uniref:AMP-binding enzyme family protein n=2 Tax=Chlamydia ibidis TaxID=1405396 RepID=S7J3N7_9CHLA|nr:AMP-binding protein [Chlamydia ibidis]EPP34637.1 AMP-binding enzyme family protein [Chlamydia ibidis]EQM62513.1 AMP-binding enzyme family protein [Chlamydia ibidis 10-1398/6]